MYTSDQGILLIGEGDFSFALSLALRFGSGANLVATSLDREAFLHCQYPNAPGNISELRSLGAIVVHGFDATRLDSTVVSRWFVNFDRVVIVWNFPHPGWGNKQPATRVQESDPIMIRRHRDLLSRFFTSALSLALSIDCSIHVTAVVSKRGVDKCNVSAVAESCGYATRYTYPIDASANHGYESKVGLPNNPSGKLVNDTFYSKQAVTRVFTLSDGYFDRYWRKAPQHLRFKMLVSTMCEHAESEVMQRQACFSMSVLSKSNDKRTRLVDVGAIEAVTAAMRTHARSEAVQKLGACTVLLKMTHLNVENITRAVTVNVENIIRAVTAGAIEAVVAAIRTHAGSEIVQDRLSMWGVK
jgi:hypothetical protein